MKKGVKRSTSHNKENRRYCSKTWKNCLSAVPAFIIGSSPSVELYDLSGLENYLTIGINRSYKGNTAKPSFPIDPTFLLWQDKSFWNTEKETIKTSQSIKLATVAADPERIAFNFTIKAGLGYSFNKIEPDCLYGRGSSGPLAVEFAYSLGCFPIVLVGLDCVVSENKQDYYGQNKFWTINTIPNCIRGLEFIKKECPVQILSCGLSTLWPKMTLNETIKLCDPENKWKQNRQFYHQKLQYN